MFLRIISITSILLLASPAAFAGKLKTWHVQGQSAYADAHFENAVIGSQGSIRLAQSLSPLAGAKFEAGQVWDMVEDREGGLYVATGGDGKLLKISPAGEPVVLYENKTGPVISLALAPGGGVFAGTGPDGKILHVSAKGEIKVLCDTGESYVWALVHQPETGLLFAATGPKGRILKVSPDGKATTFLQTKQEHVLCLAAGTAGRLYAGTDKQGLIYRIDSSGKGFVLYQAPQGEVHSLLVTPTALYAGTAAPTKKRGSASASSSVSMTTTALTKEAATGEKASVQAPAPSTPGNGENSVYRIAADGSVREVFREKAQMLCLAKRDGKLLVGTGMDGKLFEIDETTRESAEVARPDVGQIMRLLRRADGAFLIGTGDAGQVLSLRDGVAARGSVVSEVFDAKLIGKWGSFTWRADVPKGSGLTLAVRGGNTSEPDSTWADWSAEFADPAAAVFQGPACRYAQFRAQLEVGRRQDYPRLHTVSLRYATLNQAPEITVLETPDLDAAPLKDPKKLKIKWTAADPNEDELTFDILVRKDGWNDWVRIEESWGKTEFEWDTTTTPSGVYRVKIVASDRTDNSEASALTGSRASAPVLVAHEPPRIALKVVAAKDGKAMVEATGSSDLVRLAAASYSLNGKRWENIFPTDGLFDGKEKSFRFEIDGLAPGVNVIVLRVKDVAANVGSADAVFTNPKK